MNKNLIGSVTTGIVAAFLMIFAAVSEYSYFSVLKEQKEQVQAQLNEKNHEVVTKNNTITNLENDKKDLEGKNKGLDNELEAKRKELDQRIGQVKKLQGSVKTVGRCLLGTMGVIEAFKQNDGDLARKSALLMEATCEEAGKIIGEVENFQTSSQTAKY